MMWDLPGGDCSNKSTTSGLPDSILHYAWVRQYLCMYAAHAVTGCLPVIALQITSANFVCSYSCFGISHKPGLELWPHQNYLDICFSSQGALVLIVASFSSLAGNAAGHHHRSRLQMLGGTLQLPPLCAIPNYRGASPGPRSAI